MNDTHVTIRGWIGGEPKLFDKDGETAFEAELHQSAKCSDSLSRLTTWYSVRCYGALAKNAAMSLSKGMPVMVRGRLTTRLWMDKSGNQNSELAIIADSVGVELSNGIVDYTKRSDRVLKPQPGEPGWTDVSERTEPEQGWTGTGDSRAGTSGSRADTGVPGADGVVDQNGGVGENGGLLMRTASFPTTSTWRILKRWTTSWTIRWMTRWRMRTTARTTTSWLTRNAVPSGRCA